MKAIAVESDAKRRAFIAENASALGTPEIEIVAGEAPQALEHLGLPGRHIHRRRHRDPGLGRALLGSASRGGRLVANVVTVEGEMCVARHRGELGGRLTRIAISRAEPVGSLLGWRPLMPVTQWAAVKP